MSDLNRNVKKIEIVENFRPLNAKVEAWIDIGHSRRGKLMEMIGTWFWKKLEKSEICESRYPHDGKCCITTGNNRLSQRKNKYNRKVNCIRSWRHWKSIQQRRADENIAILQEINKMTTFLIKHFWVRWTSKSTGNFTLTFFCKTKPGSKFHKFKLVIALIPRTFWSNNLIFFRIYSFLRQKKEFSEQKRLERMSSLYYSKLRITRIGVTRNIS